jgi:quinol monooxygenase YgiN
MRQGSKGGLATNTLLEVLELLEQLVKKVQEEDGILQYDLFWNEQAQDVVFIEK